MRQAMIQRDQTPRVHAELLAYAAQGHTMEVVHLHGGGCQLVAEKRLWQDRGRARVKRPPTRTTPLAGKAKNNTLGSNRSALQHKPADGSPILEMAATIRTDAFEVARHVDDAIGSLLVCSPSLMRTMPLLGSTFLRACRWRGIRLERKLRRWS